MIPSAKPLSSGKFFVAVAIALTSNHAEPCQVYINKNAPRYGLGGITPVVNKYINKYPVDVINVPIKPVIGLPKRS